MVKKLSAIGIALLLMSAFSLNAFAASAAYPWVQSKTNWCWATVAKAMIDTRTGVSVPSSYTQINNQTGIRTDYCLYSGGIYITDKAQEYIVRTYKASGTSFTGTLADYLAGSPDETGAAVAGMTEKTTTNYGTWNTLPFENATTRATYIDNKLVVNSKEVCGNVYSHDASASTSKGHSLLIVEKLSTGSYKTWNSWTNSYVTYTADALCSTGIKPAPYTGTTMYLKNAVYFTS